MEPLNKLILNNKIVDMRHSVKQSRVQSINKLVKEIKKLRSNKCTDEQKKAKCNSKADKYVECIQIMKKVKEDDVSKFALMNEKSLAEITNNVNESPEIKAIARIADHRPIHDKVKAFREKYPDWKETLPLLFDSLGERYQEKKKYNNSSKNKTKLTENKTKTKSENEKKSSNVTYICNKLGTWRVEEIVSSEEDDTSDTRSVQKIGKNENRNEITNKSFSDVINCPENNEVEKDETCEISRKNVTQKLKEENKKEPTKEKNFKKLTKENENPISEEKIIKTIDPFFVTKDNKEYLSVNVVNNAPSLEDEKLEFCSNPKRFKNNFSEPKSYEKNRNQAKVVSKKYPKLEAKEETLHPSWEAKRKQSSITQFQGKKVKFDD